MKKIIVYAWRVGFNKVSFTKLLRNELGYSLPDAKDVTDGIMENRPVTIVVEDDRFPRIFSKLEELGANFRVDGEGF